MTSIPIIPDLIWEIWAASPMKTSLLCRRAKALQRKFRRAAFPQRMTLRFRNLLADEQKVKFQFDFVFLKKL